MTQLRQRYTIWFAKTYSFGRYYSFQPLPAIELTWIPGNRSFHVELQFLFWEFKLSTFWKSRRRLAEEHLASDLHSYNAIHDTSQFHWDEEVE